MPALKLRVVSSHGNDLYHPNATQNLRFEEIDERLKVYLGEGLVGLYAPGKWISVNFQEHA